MRTHYQWRIGGGCLELGGRTLVMGIVNATPDSFSDGGRFLAPERAIEHALELLEEGAAILDIGGESTRPGTPVAGALGLAGAVSAAEECDRVLPVVEGLHRLRPEAVLSVDTYKAEVARQAVEAGAAIVNDVSGLRWDAAMAGTLASLDCGAVLMHTRGLPGEWRTLPREPEIGALVRRELQEIAGTAAAAGIARERIVLDPGYGFGKNFEDNYRLLAAQKELAALGFPLLVGVSRKSFLGRSVEQRYRELQRPDLSATNPAARLAATLAFDAAAMERGAQILRVHDVRAAVEAAAITDELLRAEES
jgi:dihydropteroate synthase